jgi:hypothetical protein
LVAIGAAITEVQSAVAVIYAELSAFARDGSQFDVLL